MIFETHAHYDDEAFDGVREELIERLPSCGIPAVVNVGASLHSSKTTLELAKRHSHVFAAIGVHPDESKELSEEGLVWLREQARLPKTVAIGEIGLDYHWDNSPREVQQYWFKRQIALAKEVGLERILKKVFPNRWESIMRVAQYMLCEGNVMYYLDDWQEEHITYSHGAMSSV